MSRLDAVAWFRNRVPPGLFLLFLAPFIAELLSSHQTPLEFINPLTFALTALPYGFGAILVRELGLRWGGGWLRLLLLALAYAVFEEGIVIRSFFNPGWAELGALANNDFIAGINWVYSFALVHFHVVFSIWSSLAIAEIVYGAARKRAWVTGPWFWLCLAGFLLWIPAGWLMSGFVPPMPHYFGAIAVFLGLVGLARFLPRIGNTRTAAREVPRPYLFFLIGMIDVAIVYFVVFFAPSMMAMPSPLVVFAFLALVNLAALFVLERVSGGLSAWDDRHRLALTSGFLTVFFLLGLLGDVVEGFQGSSLVTLAFIAFLLQLRDKVRAEPRPVEQML